jgi:transposase
MEYARKALPAVPQGGVTAGIDWASADHAVCVVDAAGKAVARFTVGHTAAGLADLVRRLRKAGAAEAAIERGDGPVAGALLGAGLTVVVITPNQVKNLRSRYGSAGNKDDRFDAFVLADTLRTDRGRLRPLEPDAPATVALRSAVRARRDLVTHRVALCNQLRAHLQGCFPGAVGLFKDLDSPVSLAFLARFDCQDRADWLSPGRLAAWLKSQGYCGRKDPAVLHARLAAAPRGAAGDDGAAQARVTRALLGALAALVAQIRNLDAQIAEQLALHADAHVFASLPRSGTVRAARLLAEIGDCRGRYPTPESLICAAGVAPSTRQSGKTRVVTFRWAPTSSSATPSATSPATPAAPAPGRPASTTTPSPAARTTPTPSGSWPAPGSTSSGTAGKTAPPTTPPATRPSSASSPKKNRRQLDTGLLTRHPAHLPTPLSPGMAVATQPSQAPVI